MMTNGPAATVGDIVEVDLARPRQRLALVKDNRYHELRGRVLEFLYQKQLRPAA
jgi:nitrate/nitrite transport system ATP-binding protein